MTRRRQLVDAAMTASRRRGCDCRPEVRFTEMEPSLLTAQVAHDPTCTIWKRDNPMSTDHHEQTCQCGQPAGTGPPVVDPDSGQPMCDACVGDRAGPGELSRLDQARATVDTYRRHLDAHGDDPAQTWLNTMYRSWLTLTGHDPLDPLTADESVGLLAWAASVDPAGFNQHRQALLTNPLADEDSP